VATFQNSEYEVHQVGLKEPGSQNFRTLAFKGEAVGVTQIYATTATAATARDRRKFFYRSNHVLLSSYEIWKVLVSLAKKKFFFIVNFHVLGLFIPKKI
jgi:hypothetical protein